MEKLQPVPKDAPFQATKENIGKLKNWLIERYSASTFNQCPHKPLPQMTGPPLELAIKPDTKPVAVHTASPVPMHWKDEVKTGLDRDVSLGVIEPVPPDEPVTWCSRMVIAAKKDGSPRRTVDLQRLNAASLRQTHHTPPPFH